ncbi:RrF2 family transcriptional regulator [Pseudothermotoga thermarum]|uniref:Transcriptional regulator, BadM/Rrf2 family n=1 Tax=Pseudothermotoga thermarum DSM 5069 TaxID=688269 RepID=F7YV64_9THEM|nr:Rrf2 family transcriptional regulator [Pseudothermotoga thermarum]AEH50363.1 transcriptional regulator, BadM/Rrf2 family [Pseudothermotoga thermarum DSM 5069]
MGITVKSEYALRIMMHLAGCGQNNPVSLTNILKEAKVPKEFAEKIVSDLRRANLIVSARGRKGGYQLTKPANEMSVFEIMAAVDEPQKIIKCNFDEECCSDPESCAIRNLVWRRLWNNIISTLKSITLQELVDNCHKE